MLGENGRQAGLIVPRRKALGMVMGAAAVAAGGTLLSACGGITIPGAVETSGGSTLTSSTANPKTASTMVAATSAGVNLVASGTDINNMADDFTYYFVQNRGPGTWSCKVNRQPAVPGDGGYALAGLLARADGTPDCAEIGLFCTDGQGVILRWRDAAGQQMNQWPRPIALGVAAPIYLQMSLARGTNAFSVSYSTNGTAWAEEGISTSMSFAGDTFLIGLAACAHSATGYAVDQFTDIQGFGKKKFYYLDVAATSPSSSAKTPSGKSGGKAS